MTKTGNGETGRSGRRGRASDQNRRNVYRYRNGWYLNWQCAGVVHRTFFGVEKHGSVAKALAAALAERDRLGANRAQIAKNAARSKRRREAPHEARKEARR